MTVYIIITASLIDGNKDIKRDYETRKQEYILGITSILNLVKNNYKVIIVENNSIIGKRYPSIHKTFLDNFKVPVFYTTTNKYITKNYGRTELIDIHKCILKYNIQDDDFIVKVTGRYIVNKDSPFFKVVNNLEQTPYSAILRYGCFIHFDRTSRTSCISGLIGLQCKYVKQLELPDDDTFVEEKWAMKIASLPENEVCNLKELGIAIRPGSTPNYMLL